MGHPHPPVQQDTLPFAHLDLSLQLVVLGHHLHDPPGDVVQVKDGREGVQAYCMELVAVLHMGREQEQHVLLWNSSHCGQQTSTQSEFVGFFLKFEKCHTAIKTTSQHLVCTLDFRNNSVDQVLLCGMHSSDCM